MLDFWSKKSQSIHTSVGHSNKSNYKLAYKLSKLAKQLSYDETKVWTRVTTVLLDIGPLTWYFPV